MNVLEIVLPVLVMIVVGMLCRKWKILTRDGINNMKVLVTNVMLPVAIFHALATAEYNKETGILILIMFVMLVVSFGLGFLLKPFLKGTYQKYLPFMVSVYEGGLMAYPLYTSLCGSENLSRIAVLDIAGLLFGFSVYMGMLGQVENGEKIDVKNCFQCIKDSGIYCKYPGNYCRIIEGDPCSFRQSFRMRVPECGKHSHHICDCHYLLVVGYSMELNAKLLKPCIATIILRVLLQAVMIAGVLVAVHYLVGDDRLVNLAIISYMSAPATFSMQTFMKDEEGSAYVSTTNSMYCLVSILVYIIMAVTIY